MHGHDVKTANFNGREFKWGYSKCTCVQLAYMYIFLKRPKRRRRSPAVACWASDHWVASSNPLRGKFRH